MCDTGIELVRKTIATLQGRRLDAVVQFKIDGIDLHYDRGAVSEQLKPADCTIGLSLDSYLKLLNGEASPECLFLQNLLSVTGNFAVMMRLGRLFPTDFSV